jgi:protein-disulfide isomerase
MPKIRYNALMKILIWVVAIFIIAVGALIVFSQNGSGSAGDFALDVVHPADHVKGNASSTVILMEYSDFQCPACRSYYPMLRELTESYGDRIAFVYRHFPLKQIHINADPAAWAAEAAGMQGKFWEMHNLLFEKQGEWEKSSDLRERFSEYAALVGIDRQKFLDDLNSKQVKDIVNSQRAGAIKNGFNSTPTFILNGVQIENPQSVAAFKLLIDKAIRESTQ